MFRITCSMMHGPVCYSATVSQCGVEQVSCSFCTFFTPIPWFMFARCHSRLSTAVRLYGCMAKIVPVCRGHLFSLVGTVRWKITRCYVSIIPRQASLQEDNVGLAGFVTLFSEAHSHGTGLASDYARPRLSEQYRGKILFNTSLPIQYKRKRCLAD